MDICSCSCCRGIRMEKFWFAVTCRKFPTTERAHVNKLFDPKHFLWKRRSVIFLDKGLESLDFVKTENKSIIEDAISRGIRYVNKDFFYKYSMLIIVGFLIGVVGGALNSIALDFVCRKNSIFRKMIHTWQYQNLHLFYVYIIGISLIPAVAGASAVAYLAPEAAGGSLASVSAYINGNNIKDALSSKTLLVLMFSATMMSLASLPGGMDDPIIHMGAIIGSKFPLLKYPFTNQRIFPIFIGDDDKKDFVLAGLAAAYAAFFGTPLGAVVWVMELFVFNWTGDMVIKILICSFASSTLRSYIVAWYWGTRGLITRNTLFFFNSSTLDSYTYTVEELLAAILLGCFGGLVGIVWNLTFKGVMSLRKRIHKYPPLAILEVAVITILDHSIWITLYLYYGNSCSPLPVNADSRCDARNELINLNHNCRKLSGDINTWGMFLLNEMNFTISILFDRRLEFIDLNPLIVIGVIFYVRSFLYGSKISSGLFMPIWGLGSIYGRIMSLTIQKFFFSDYVKKFMIPLRCVYYGSVAVHCGIYRSAAAITITVWEATTNTILEFPIFVVVIVSKFIADLCVLNVFAVKNEVSRIPMLKLSTGQHAEKLTAEDVMGKYPLVTLAVKSNIKRLLEVSFETRHNGFPVVNSAFTSKKEIATFGRLEGLIVRPKILELLKLKWLELTTLPEKQKQNIDVFRTDFVNVLPKPANADLTFDINASVDLTSLMDDAPQTVLHLSPGNQVYQLFTSLGLRHLPVVNKANEVAGIITRKDIDLIKRKQFFWS